MSASYYQSKLDAVNVAIAAQEIATATLEVRFADGRAVKSRNDLEALYAERARLEVSLNRVSYGGIRISRGAAL